MMFMLINYNFSGYKTFKNDYNFSMKANRRIKKTEANVYNVDNDLALVKSAIIYGPNNTGKSTFLESLRTFKDIFTKGDISIIENNPYFFNIFNENPVKTAYFEVEFLADKKNYTYGIEISSDVKILDEYLYVGNRQVLDRKGKNGYKATNELVKMMLHLEDKLFIKMLPKEQIEYMTIVKDFFNKLIFIDDGAASIDLTIQLLKEGEYNQQLVDILTNLDVNISNIMLDDNIDLEKLPSNTSIKKKAETFIQQFKLTTTYIVDGVQKEVPSILFDSLGTKKMTIIAGYIIKALRENKILIIDELDKSLHTFITKTVINMFNLDSNEKAQLIATVHDLLLLDNTDALRKDQIWFTALNDDKIVELFCLDDFKDNSGVDTRGTYLNKYLKGLFGALPYPDISFIK